mmetsp:Transcript_19436/g.64377  ORF Transcript_19436/g.64377 Transcript_19436/m.64377 type:complete len:481 (-) Transcript_19436:1330-2772(-)
MPLTRRFATELSYEWQTHCICYKDLQREAENLVGDYDEELEMVFKFHLTVAIEQANNFYLTKETHVKECLEDVSKAVDAVAEVHLEREAKHLPPAMGRGYTKMLGKSPTTSTDHLWAAIHFEDDRSMSEEDLDFVRDFFEIWKSGCKEKKGVITLSDFVNDCFMSRLEEGALQTALREWLQLLTYIDSIRNFAILNSAAAVKLLQRHSSQATCDEVMAVVSTLPMFHMSELYSVITEMELLAERLQYCLSPSSHVEVPTTWSPHICPFCTHTVTNAVILQGGRICCWACALKNSSNAIVYCPITFRQTDLRQIKLERVLATFLRRFFPESLKSVPAALLGHEEKVEEEEETVHGILSMMKARKKKEEPRPRPHTARRSRRQQSSSYSSSLDLTKLDQDVTVILKKIHDDDSSRGYSPPRCLLHCRSSCMPDDRSCAGGIVPYLFHASHRPSVSTRQETSAAFPWRPQNSTHISSPIPSTR